MFRSLPVILLAACGTSPGGSPDPTNPIDPGTTPSTVPDPTDPAEAGPASTPVLGGGVAILLDGTIAAIDEAGARLVFLSAGGGAKLGEVAFAAGSQPQRLVQGDDGLVWVVLRRAGQVAAVDPSAAAVTQTLSVCPAPRGIDRDPGDGSLWVACASGELVHFDGEGVRTSWLLGTDLRDVVVDRADGDLWVSRFRAAEVLRVSANDGTVLKETGPEHFVSGALRAPFEATVAYRMIPDPEGGVYLLHQRSSEGPQQETPNAYGGEHCGGNVLTDVTHFDDAGSQSARLIDQAPVPVDLAFTPSGQLAIAAAGARLGSLAEQSVVRVASGDWVSDGPGLDCLTPANERPHDGHVVSAIAYDAQGRQVAVAQQPFAVLVDGVEVDASDPVEDELAFRAFTQNAGLGVACASCHPEGLDDGQVWNFVTLGDRRTQSLGGGILATAPFHWDGAFPTFGDLAHDVFLRMGSEEGTDVGALAAWIDGIDAPVVTPRGTADEIAAGEALFASAELGCAACHSGPRFTDNGSHDVGTGEVLQTPSLVGVGGRLPLMHDGCAPSLEARFLYAGCGGGDAHGVTSGLSEADVGALAAYLETL